MNPLTYHDTTLLGEARGHLARAKADIVTAKERLASLDPASPEVKHLHGRCEVMETQLTATKQGVERVLDEGRRARRALRGWAHAV